MEMKVDHLLQLAESYVAKCVATLNSLHTEFELVERNVQ